MKKKVIATVVLLQSLYVLSGCVGGKIDNESGSAGKPADSREKMKITFMTRAGNGGGWPDNHPVLQAMSEKLNIDMQMEWIPTNLYSEKLNVLVASGNLPDIYFVNYDEFRKWQSKGLFLDVKPLITSYPNLTQYIPEKNWALMNPKGKYYGIPHYVPEVRDSLMIRKDWLDRLHLTMPETIDEWYETAKAFKNDDPDGNGLNDTLGFSFSQSPNGSFSRIDFVRGAFGLANGWKEEDGKLIPWYIQTHELKDFIGFLRRAYDEGVLDNDFAVQEWQDPLRKFEAGMVGFTYVNPSDVYDKTISALKQIAPDSEVVQLPPPQGPTGIRVTPSSGSRDKLVINSKSPPEKQKRILQLLDYLLSDEGYDLTRNGVEGIHYKKTDNGKYVQLDAYETERAYIFSSWVFRRFDPLVSVRKWDDARTVANLTNWYKALEQYKWYDASLGLESLTDNKIGPDINKKWSRTMIEIIVGRKPLEAIDQAADNWIAEGGGKIIEEYNAEYQRNKTAN